MGLNNTVIEYDLAKLKIILYFVGRNSKEYIVTLEEGYWCTSEELYNICDSGSADIEPEDRLFSYGEMKEISSTERKIIIYT